MLNTIYINNDKIINFVKEGRIVWCNTESGLRIKSSDLKSISIVCNTCKSYSIINFRSALKNKTYICQSCVKTGDKNPFFGRSHLETTKVAHSKFMKNKFVGDKNHFYGKKHSVESIEKMKNNLNRKQIGEKNGFYSKTHSTEVKELLSIKSKNYRLSLSPEQLLKESIKHQLLQNEIKNRDPDKYKLLRQKAGKVTASKASTYKMNKLESLFNSLLICHNITDFEFSVIINYKQFDFGSKKHRILIEVHGDYWHGNPKFYGDTLKPLNNIQKNKINEDKIKYDLAQNYNFKLLTFWEYDIHNNPQKVIEEIKNAISIS
jgi:very-short-patch-repair endonuclease